MYLLAQFILQNFKKFLKMIQSYENVPFSDPKWPICLGQKIFGTNIYIIFIKLLVLFIVQNFKKILTGDPEL